MKAIHVLIFSLLILFISHSTYSQQPDHSEWDKLLKQFVNEKGEVDYQSFRLNQQSLDTYLKLLSGNPPQESWSDNEQLSFWINAYNAFTISLILRHYPLKSIMDIEKAWEVRFISIGNTKYTLNEIEHEVIRKKFDEPRIHFVLVCAAISCPVLLNEAYFPDRLEKQMQKQTIQFINDFSRNSIKSGIAKVSQLFNWYKDDFTKQGTVIDYLNRYSETKLNPDANLSFMEYDWGLNESK